MRDHIILDIDGTISDSAWRQDYARARQWDDFHSRCEADKPHPDVLDMILRLSLSMQILACTGRTETYREQTMRWMTKHGVPIDHLIMRGVHDFSRAGDMKISSLEAFFGSKEAVLERVAFVLEDNDRSVELFRNYGLPCWQVRSGGA